MSGDCSLLDAAVELAVPPLGLLTAASVLGLTAAAVLAAVGVIPVLAVLPWLVAVVAIVLYVLVGFRAAHAPPSAYRALARSPIFVLRKLPQIGRLLRFRGDTWVRTERARSKRD